MLCLNGWLLILSLFYFFHHSYALTCLFYTPHYYTISNLVPSFCSPHRDYFQFHSLSQENSALRHTSFLSTKCFGPIFFPERNEDFSAHREALNKDYRYPSLPQSLQSVGNFYLLHAEVKTLITALWDLAIQGKTCSLDMVINPHLEEVRRGKKRNSNFNCGHFKNRISSHMYFMVRVAV